MGAFVGSWPSSLSEISLDKATRDVAGFEGNEAQFKQFVRRIATDAPEGRIQPGSSFYFCRPHPADQETYVFSGPYQNIATAKTAGKKACDDFITSNTQEQLPSEPLQEGYAHSMQPHQQQQQQQQRLGAQQAAQQNNPGTQHHQQHQHQHTQQMQRGRPLERSLHGRTDTSPPRTGSLTRAGQLGLSPKGGVGKQTHTRSTSSSRSPQSADRRHSSTVVTRGRSGLANVSNAASAGLSMQPAAPQHPPAAAAYTADGSDAQDMDSEGPNMAAAGQPGASNATTGPYRTALQPQHPVTSATGTHPEVAPLPQHQMTQQQLLPASPAEAAACLRTSSSAPDMQRAGSSQHMPSRLGVSLQQRQLSHNVPTAGAGDAASFQQQEHCQLQQQQQQPQPTDTLTAVQLLQQQQQQQGQQLRMLPAALSGPGTCAAASHQVITAAGQQLLLQQLQGVSAQQRQQQQPMVAGVSPLLGELMIQLGQQLQQQASSGAVFNTAAAPAAFAAAGGSGLAPQAQLFGPTGPAGQQLLQPVPGGVQQQAAYVSRAGDGASAGAAGGLGPQLAVTMQQHTSAGGVGQQQQQAGMPWSSGALLNAAGAAAAEVRGAGTELPPHSLPSQTATTTHPATHQLQQQQRPAAPAGTAATNPVPLVAAMARASLTHSASSIQQQQQHPAQHTAATGAGFSGLRDHIQSLQQPPASSAAAPAAEASPFAAGNPPAAARSATVFGEARKPLPQQQQEPAMGQAAGPSKQAGGRPTAARQPSQQELQQQIQGYMAKLSAGSINLLTKQDLVLLEKLGAGAFGTVYKADWDGAQVAVKCLNSRSLLEEPGNSLQAVMELLREAVLLAWLRHPNILSCSAVVLPDSMLQAVTAAGGNVSSSSHPAAAAQHPTPPAIVMEYISNGSLHQAIASNALWLAGRRAKVKVMCDTAVGLSHLHGRAIVHFDLKADNLLVNLTAPDMTPEVKIGDLGLVKVKQQSIMTGDFGMRGTPAYIAPELLTRDAACNATQAVDVYSFGVVMWEVWTFMSPTDVELPITLLAQRSQGKFGLPIPGTHSWKEQQGDSPPEPAVGWSALMQRCLEAAASSRPTSAELVTALKAVLESLS